jgi:uncharacterized protein (UPF0210 family)
LAHAIEFSWPYFNAFTDIGTMVIHFVNLFEYWEESKMTEVGYEFGAVAYDMECLATGKSNVIENVKNDVTQDVEHPVDTVERWGNDIWKAFISISPQRKLAASDSFKNQTPKKSEDMNITSGSKALEVFLEEFIGKMTGQYPNVSDCVSYSDEDNKLLSSLENIASTLNQSA